jgi:hypothetical protein
MCQDHPKMSILLKSVKVNLSPKIQLLLVENMPFHSHPPLPHSLPSGSPLYPLHWRSRPRPNREPRIGHSPRSAGTSVSSAMSRGRRPGTGRREELALTVLLSAPPPPLGPMLLFRLGVELPRRRPRDVDKWVLAAFSRRRRFPCPEGMRPHSRRHITAPAGAGGVEAGGK